MAKEIMIEKNISIRKILLKVFNFLGRQGTRTSSVYGP